MQGGSRRRGRRRAVRSGLIIVIASLVAGFFTVGSPAKAATTYSTYHDESSASHASRTKDLLAQGYRPTSLSVFGSTAAPRYAATWVKRPGAEIKMFQDQTPIQFSSNVRWLTTAGWRPALLTATSDAAGTIFASSWEQDPSGTATFDTNMTLAEFTARNAEMRDKDHTLRSAVAYGSRFAATWWPEEFPVPWNVDTGLSGTDVETVRVAHMANGVRPDLISLGSGSSAGKHVAVWRDDRIGPQVMRTSMTKSEYETAREQFKAAYGMFPVRLQGGLVNGEHRYAAVFALNDEVIPRTWTVTGPDSGPVGSGFDQQMQNLMTFSGVRTGALAVVKDGKLIHSRGYAFAEPGESVTKPTTQFRIASCTKPLTAIAIAQLIEKKLLNYSDKVQDILKLTTPTGGFPTDARFKNITIENLLTHTGGWDRDITAEPWDPDVAAAFGTSLPVSKAQNASYVAGRTLDFAPGERSAYSNLGYQLLGRVIEAKSGTSYESFVKNGVFGPLGLSRPAIGASAKSTQASDESVYVPRIPWLVASVLQPNRPLVASPYGSYNVANGDSAGGWRMAAPDLARVLAAFDAQDNPLFDNDAIEKMLFSRTLAASEFATGAWMREFVNDANGVSRALYHHNGILTGERCMMTRRNDGVSIVVLLGGERDLFGGVQGKAFNDRVNEWPFSSWPTADLFPQMGIAK